MVLESTVPKKEKAHPTTRILFKDLDGRKKIHLRINSFSTQSFRASHSCYPDRHL